VDGLLRFGTYERTTKPPKMDFASRERGRAGRGGETLESHTVAALMERKGEGDDERDLAAGREEGN